MAFDLFLTLVLGTARLPVTMLASHVVFLFVGLGSVDFKTGMGRTWSPIMLAVVMFSVMHFPQDKCSKKQEITACVYDPKCRETCLLCVQLLLPVCLSSLALA